VSRQLSLASLKVLKEAAAKSGSKAAAAGLGVDIYCDGASRGNPGPAGAGAMLLQEGGGKVLARVCKALGRATNNEAEYAALLLGLQEARSMNAVRVAVYADSELVIKQLNGVYRVKHPVMRQRHQEAMRLLAGFEAWRATHVPRERNTEADRLANQALDSPGGGQ
jgi:ribonuclease HI